MAILPVEVKPGELISSEWINDLLAKLAELDAQVQLLAGSVGTGSIVVPDLFGRTLTQARQILTLPAQQLSLGSLVDAVGANVNPNSAEAGALIVIGQYPVPGARSVPGGAVSLLLSATPGAGGPPTSQSPTIGGFSPEPAPAGAIVTIVGTNFLAARASNIVTIGGLPVAAEFGSNFLQLLVRVPTNLPGAPATPEDDDVEFPVIVNTGIGTPASAMLTVTAPPAGPAAPALTAVNNIAPGVFQPTVGQSVEILGQNFSSTSLENLIHFGATATAPAQTATPTRLTVIIPNIPEITGPTAGVNIGFRVGIRVGGEGPEVRISAPPFPVLVQRL